MKVWYNCGVWKMSFFANVSDKQSLMRFRPIVSNFIRTWHIVESECKISCKWHTLSPLFNNEGLMIGGRPISNLFLKSYSQKNRHNSPLEINGNFFHLALSYLHVEMWFKTCSLSKTPNSFYITCKLFKLWAVKRGVEITFSSKLEWKHQFACV